jgi:glycosyltransferase involved in cell wall biosynthesis
MLRLSVIIPVYNGEKCLPTLIESLQAQNIAQEDYELLFVDDCSSDASVSLIERYSKEFPNIRLVRHEKNRRLASTCNTGLDYAKGVYLWFVDQDDRVEPDSMGFLLQEVESQKLDLLLFNFRRMSQTGKVIASPKIFENTDVMDGVSFLRRYFPDDFDNYLLGYRWRALFSKAYLLNEGISFIDGMMYDDTTILLESILYAKRVASLSGFYYYYYVNDVSITYARGKKGERIFEFAFLVGNEVADFAEKVQLVDDSWAEILKRRCKKYYNSYPLDLMRTSRKERHKFYETVMANNKVVDQVKSKLDGIGKLLLLPMIGQLMAGVLSYIYRLKHGKE